MMGEVRRARERRTGATTRVRHGRSWRTFVALGFLVPAAAGAAAYVDGPPPAHTGGFDEPTCHACHFENAINADGGALTIDVPATYEPGRRYTLRIELRHAALKRGGFELATRFAAGRERGRQAGTLDIAAEVGRVTPHDDVAYAHHVRTGTEPAGAGVASWTVEWTAPTQPSADVAVHVAANAANDDNSEFGDHIYTAHATIAAAGKQR
jgi:hypothetical protein